MAVLNPLKSFTFKTPVRITLAKKLFFGYVTMVVFTLLVGGYALFSLNTISGISDSMVKRDFPLMESVDKMTENLLAQDLYEKRFMVFRDPAIKSLFDDHGNEFREWLDRYKTYSLGEQDFFPNLAKLHRDYEEWSKKEMDLLEHGQDQEASVISKGVLNEKMDGLVKNLKAVAGQVRTEHNEKILQTYRIGQHAFSVTILLCFVSGVFGLGFATLLIYNLSVSIRRLKEATRFIAEGEFDRIPSIQQSRDEVGDLAESFQWMTSRLKVLEEMNIDANPLTRLPGNLAIEKVLLTRLQSEAQFAFCFIDLDNFKAFGDRYGYARGSEVLKGLAQILVETVKKLGSPSDFVGHIGGDDFVLITEPVQVPVLCEAMIKHFDERIPDYYDPEDRERGFIISKDRKDVEQSFPIMTLSIAVVTNKKRVLSSPAQIAEIAAQLKQYAKTFPKSVYVVDQRRSP